jgi:hypothetical protein
VFFVCASDSLLKSAKAKVVAAVAVAVAAAIATNRVVVEEEGEGEGEGAARGRREVAKEPVARGWVQEDVGDVVEKEAKEAIERGDVRCRRSRRRRTLIAMLKILFGVAVLRTRPLAPFPSTVITGEHDPPAIRGRPWCDGRRHASDGAQFRRDRRSHGVLLQ